MRFDFKLNQKAQQIIEYMLLMAAVVAGVLGVAGPGGPMKGAVERSLNQAVETIYGHYTWREQVSVPCTAPSGCGLGTVQYNVWCQDENGNTVNDSLCLTQGPKPLEVRPCDLGNCGGYYWWTSDWDPRVCPVQCGGAVQTREVKCFDSGGAEVSPLLCPPGRPDDSQACGSDPCYQWETSLRDCEYPPGCSATCGVGTCPPMIRCKSFVTGATVPDANCGVRPTPAPINCDTSVTCGYQWVVGDWGNCSDTCFDGVTPVTQSRTVRCVRLADGADMPTGPGSPCLPAGPAPPTTQSCTVGPCNHWVVEGDWGACTRPCGTGTQDVNVVCKDRNGITIPDTSCDPATRPASTRNCNTGACVWVVGSAYGACTHPQNCGMDGIRTRTLRCIQSGFPATFLQVVWCASASVPSPGGAANCSAPTDMSCTQNDTCVLTSGCCGNGVINIFTPGYPYAEQCDNGAANSNTCPTTCTTACKVIHCPCSLPWGGSIDHGESVDAYANSSVACGGSCVHQTRKCTDGSLSGSYEYGACWAVCASCDPGSRGSGATKCSYPATYHGESKVGTCAEDGTCSVSCYDGTATVTNNCTPIVCTTESAYIWKVGAYGCDWGGSPISKNLDEEVCLPHNGTNTAVKGEMCAKCTASGWNITNKECSPVCVSTTCAAQGKNCGEISDGCGRTIDCGSCVWPLKCGGVSANVCGCKPPHYKVVDGVCKPSCGGALLHMGWNDVGSGCKRSPCSGNQYGGEWATWDCKYCCENP